VQSNVTRQDLAKSIAPAETGRISFLTLTNHFYSLASPLPQGKGMYPTLMSIPDVVGFDLYPLQVWCRPAFGDVMDAPFPEVDVRQSTDSVAKLLSKSSPAVLVRGAAGIEGIVTRSDLLDFLAHRR